jgi:hypothetical protein
MSSCRSLLGTETFFVCHNFITYKMLLLICQEIQNTVCLHALSTVTLGDTWSKQLPHKAQRTAVYLERAYRKHIFVACDNLLET